LFIKEFKIPTHIFANNKKLVRKARTRFTYKVYFNKRFLFDKEHIVPGLTLQKLVDSIFLL